MATMKKATKKARRLLKREVMYIWCRLQRLDIDVMKAFVGKKVEAVEFHVACTEANDMGTPHAFEQARKDEDVFEGCFLRAVQGTQHRCRTFQSPPCCAVPESRHLSLLNTVNTRKQ